MQVYVQITLGIVLLVGLMAMAVGYVIVPTDPATKALFDRIIDAIFIVLNVPLIATFFSTKGERNEKDSAPDYNSGP